MKNVIWNVEAASPPPVLRYCRKCGEKTAFCSSGQFRVNAQRKSLDVWLIYKCSVCGTTWNAEILSRVSPQALPAQMLDGFHRNDRTLAAQYAMDPVFLRRNGVQAGASDLTVLGDVFAPEEEVTLEIHNRCPLPLTVAAVVRKKLRLSRNAYSALLASERLQSVPPRDLRKCRLPCEITLIFRQT